MREALAGFFWNQQIIENTKGLIRANVWKRLYVKAHILLLVTIGIKLVTCELRPASVTTAVFKASRSSNGFHLVHSKSAFTYLRQAVLPSLGGSLPCWCFHSHHLSKPLARYCVRGPQIPEKAKMLRWNRPSTTARYVI